jgi:hypothetical protein
MTYAVEKDEYCGPDRFEMQSIRQKGAIACLKKTKRVLFQ